MAQPRSLISQAEQTVLKALWEQGPGTVREIRKFLEGQGVRWAHSTVITLLGRLEAKSCVRVDKSAFAHRFHPAVTREDVARQRLAALADELFDGSTASLVLAFARQYPLSDQDVEQLRKLIEKPEADRARRKRRN